jgi:DNA-binding beta-propeller fold protein YncE
MRDDYNSGKHQKQSMHPVIYVARLTRFLKIMENFHKKYLKMDEILATSLKIQERDMTELKREIKLWWCASRSRTLISDLSNRIYAVLKSNQENASDPKVIWPVVGKCIRDITEYFASSVSTRWPGEVTKNCDAVTTDFEGNVCILKTELTEAPKTWLAGRPGPKFSRKIHVCSSTGVKHTIELEALNPYLKVDMESSYAVAVGPSGKIFVVDRPNSRIVCFRTSGKFERVFGNQHLHRPHGIAVDRLGQVFVADTCNHRIAVFNEEGGFERAYGREPHEQSVLNYPKDVAVDLEGNVFVPDSENNRIVVFKENGDCVRTLGGGSCELKYPTAVAVDRAGHVFVADRNNYRVAVFTWFPGSRNGDFVGSLKTKSQPDKVAVDWAGNVFVIPAILNDHMIVFDKPMRKIEEVENNKTARNELFRKGMLAKGEWDNDLLCQIIANVPGVTFEEAAGPGRDI